MPPNMPEQRSKDRVRKTLNFPEPLHDALEQIADKKYGGDFSRAVIEELAKEFPKLRKEVGAFMERQAKFSPRKK